MKKGTTKPGEIVQVLIGEKRFGDHILSTGPLWVPLIRGRKIICRVIAFNWATHPEVGFHSCN